MKKSTQRVLSLVLALVMVFGFASPVLAQTGELPGPDTTYNFNIDVTLNGLAGIVDGWVDFYLRGKTPNGDWMAYEFDDFAVIENGEGEFSLDIPAEIEDEDSGTVYKTADLQNLEVWVGLAEIEEPIHVVYFDDSVVLNPAILDEYEDEIYWTRFPVADLDPTVPVDVNFDLVHVYPQINDDDFTIRVVDREGRGIEGATVNLHQVVKGDDVEYALDENGDYIVDEDAEVDSLGETDARGYLVLSKEDKDAAAAFLGTTDENINIVGALRAVYGDLETSTTFVNFASENNKALIVMGPKDTHFKVTVVSRDNDLPFYAVEGAHVRIVENVGELWGAPAMGETLAEGYTNANGEYVFTNIALQNLVSYNIPKDVEFNELIIKGMLRNNWLVVEKDGYTRVQRLIDNEEIAEGEARVVLLETGVDYTNFIDRIKGANRYETAVEVAKRTFEDIPQTFILASGEDFADALVANGLTNVLDAPILLTRRNALPEETAAYLAAAKAHHGSIRVHIIGGTNAITGAVEGEIEREFSAVTSRMSGKNRYETATSIARYMFTQGVAGAWTGDVLVANGQNFPDAIIASLPAAQYGKPILLTGPDELHPITFEALNNRLDGVSIYNHATVIGGDAVISDHAYGQINMVDKERLYGANRYLTSLNALREMYPDATKLYVVSGAQYTDALVAAKLAADNNAAILLVHPTGLTAEAEAYLRSSEITDITIIGGTNALSDNVAEQLARILLSR